MAVAALGATLASPAASDFYQMTVPAVPPDDPRLDLIDREDGKPLAGPQRAEVSEILRGRAESAREMRRFPVADGTEPGFVFRPTPLPPPRKPPRRA